jgi:hypothetical protein
MDPVVDLVGLAAGVEEVAGTELVAEAVTQCDETAQRLGVDFAACLDLETDNGAVERLGNEVDLVAVVGSPMTEFPDVVAPGSLLRNRRRAASASVLFWIAMCAPMPGDGG